MTHERRRVAHRADRDTEESTTVAGHVVIRRGVNCAIESGLLRLGEPRWRLAPSVVAGLLWRAYQRYSALVGLKRLTGGLSGNDVLVFRPKLKTPTRTDDPDLATSGPCEVLADAWGSPLLVKTGKEDQLRKEWVRYNHFLRDRQSPFIAHLEEFLVVHPEPTPAEEPLAVLIGSFLGGAVIQVEPLDKVIRGTQDVSRCLKLLEQVFGHLATWHTNPQPRPLAEWSRSFYFDDHYPDEVLLFGRYNFRKKSQEANSPSKIPTAKGNSPLGREEFADGLRWDVPFGQSEHLKGHLLGTEKTSGLLTELQQLKVQFSLIHGDLNPRNVLCDDERTWLIDFEHTGVGPIFADFARLEVNLRFWCIELAPPSTNTGQAAEKLERLLLAHFHGSESSLEPVRQFAHEIGADPDELSKIARCIIHVRHLARRWCGAEFVDGRDYLAVLYLTVLRLLQAAAASGGHVGAANIRWGMGLFWLLEEALNHILGRTPFDRGQLPYNPLRHLTAEWLRPDDAVDRVHYVCDTADGREVLQPVVALRGVLQGTYHHLDAYEHTLAVLAYLEAILRDPVHSLLNPHELDAHVATQWARLGLAEVRFTPTQIATPLAAEWFTPVLRQRTEAMLKAALTDEAKLLLKWCAVLHDVGKPGTRTVRAKGTGAEVQFIGHERHGLSLLGERLATWFPNPADQHRLERLIEQHHASHQVLGNRLFADASLLNGLQQPENQPLSAAAKELLKNERAKAEADLPLLLLHGYADRLAARGVRQTQSVAAWAEATLALLRGVTEET